MPASEFDKSSLRDKINSSETFCMFPWIHLHVTPIGTAAPCCISGSCNNHEGVGDARSNKLMDLVNSPKMKQLRLDMINGVKSDECTTCYLHESNNVKSFRQESLQVYANSMEDVLSNTNEDGSLTDFNMQYFDMRFSNLCNFKCRTCGQEFSSQWEQENNKQKLSYAATFPKGANKELLQDVVDQIPNFQKAYFAGGEPLIMEEHYVLLEEMIRQGRTDVVLVYNTNISNLKFKDKDLIGLWKHFSKHVQVYASIDHVRERAEYIRHGTDWAVVEQNIKTLRQHDFIRMTMNTVLSIFNFLTIDKFYQYVVKNNLYTPQDISASFYCMSTPAHLSCISLPEQFKVKGNESLSRAILFLHNTKFRAEQIAQIEQAKSWAFSQDIWDSNDYHGVPNKLKLKREIERLDRIRGESFENVFPELKPLLDLIQ